MELNTPLYATWQLSLTEQEIKFSKKELYFQLFLWLADNVSAEEITSEGETKSLEEEETVS